MPAPGPFRGLLHPSPAAAGRSILVAALAVCASPALFAEVVVEAEGQRFGVSFIGERPPVSVGADVGNDLRLEAWAPALSLSIGRGTRRAVLRCRALDEEHAYATANPSLVLEGEQRVDYVTIDALVEQGLGTHIRLEAGYRYVDLDRSWRDRVDIGSGLASLDYRSQLTGHGLRGALAVDIRFLGRLHLQGTAGLSVVWAQETFRSSSTNDGGRPSDTYERVFEGGRTVTVPEVAVRLRVDVTSRFWLAAGYRSETWGWGEIPEFESHGPTLAVGVRLGGSP